MKRHPIIEGVMADIEGLDFADDEKRQDAEESIICTVQTLIDRLATADAEISASQEEITRLRKALEEAESWKEMAKAGLELAEYASYSEIVGCIGHNRTAIRKWCDKVLDFHRAREKAEWDRLVAEDEAARALLPTHPHEGDSA